MFAVSLDAFGAQGGDFTGVSGITNSGGLGGHVAATVSVVPGQVLLLSIGSGGGRKLTSSTTRRYSHIHVTDGSNGEGCSSDMGGHGGDATYLHSVDAITEELSLLMIVGGGGGAGERGSGGSGGGQTAGNGYDTRLNATGTVGHGGNQSVGGLPGGQVPYSGTMGLVGVGGCGRAGGGGGGNGYFGGGGGGQVADRLQGGGGGGGGSSFYASSNVTLHTNLLGANLGNGRIIVIYDTGAPSSSPISHCATGNTENASAAGSSDAIVISASLISGAALFLVLGVSLCFCGISFSCCGFKFCGSSKSAGSFAGKSNKIHVIDLDEDDHAMNKDVDCDERGLVKNCRLPQYFSCHTDLDSILSAQGFSYSVSRHKSGILREKPLLSKKLPAPSLSQIKVHVGNNEEDLGRAAATDVAIDAAIDAAFLSECARLTSKYRRKVCDESKKLAIAQANKKFCNGLESVSCLDSLSVSTSLMSTSEVGANHPPQSPSSFSSKYYLNGEIDYEESTTLSDDNNTDNLAGVGSEYSEAGFLARVWANSLFDNGTLTNVNESVARHAPCEHLFRRQQLQEELCQLQWHRNHDHKDFKSSAHCSHAE